MTIEIAVAVVEHQGCYLIGLRPAGVPLTGYWEFPGGKLRAGETPAAAAVRECREETGLKVEAGSAYPTVEHDYPHGRLRLHFLACRAAQPDEPLPPRFRWAPAAELDNYQFPPANATLLAMLRARATT
jgi:mutator protein MutT